MQRQPEKKPLQSEDGLQRIPAGNGSKDKVVAKETQTASGGNKCAKCGGKHPTKTCNKQPANPKLGALKPPAKKANVLPKGPMGNKSQLSKRMNGRRGN